MRKIALRVAAVALGLAVSHPAAARVYEETESSFVVRLGVDVPAAPDNVWAVLTKPQEWWESNDTFSGDAANLSLEPRGGGCFCEVLPNKESKDAPPRGSAEHMRVVYAEQPRALRMVGALGPIQPDAVTGVMTMVLQPGDSGTRILWEYAVAGHFRKPGMAGVIDAALTGQILRLGEKLGARLAPRSRDTGKGDGATGKSDDGAGHGDPGAGEEKGAAPDAGQAETGAAKPGPEAAQEDLPGRGEEAGEGDKAPFIGR